jgi:protein phosphatase
MSVHDPKTPPPTTPEQAGRRADAGAAHAQAAANSGLVKGRYQLGDMKLERAGLSRYRAVDHGLAGTDRAPITLVREPVVNDGAPASAAWPSLAWEGELLDKCRHSFLPSMLDRFSENGSEYLVEKIHSGRSLRDAWADPSATWEQRFGWLGQIADGLRRLHAAGAMIGALRPDSFIVSRKGRVRLTDLSALLPLPVPADMSPPPSLCTAPELLAEQGADARADLYAFGALLFALWAGRDLATEDFEDDGPPWSVLARSPDIHPLLGRLIGKTFCRDIRDRFPTEDAVADPTGFTELISILGVCRRTLDQVRLDVAAWTSTGIVRTTNEDAFVVVHGAESHRDSLGESALILVADGMGGAEAGEVAAALAVQSLRRYLLRRGPFSAVTGEVEHLPGPRGVEPLKQLVCEALLEANGEVLRAARTAIGRPGMGCTAEVVCLSGRDLVVGHVGDSRTYRLRKGVLTQITNDHTLIGRLVEMGGLTPEQAADHPGRAQLLQVMGGKDAIEPALYHAVLEPGDMVLVCSDGLTNQVASAEIVAALASAGSAEAAARRLVNLANLKGAADNVTVVVVCAS